MATYIFYEIINGNKCNESYHHNWVGADKKATLFWKKKSLEFISLITKLFVDERTKIKPVFVFTIFIPPNSYNNCNCGNPSVMTICSFHSFFCSLRRSRSVLIEKKLDVFQFRLMNRLDYHTYTVKEEYGINEGFDNILNGKQIEFEVTTEQLFTWGIGWPGSGNNECNIKFGDYYPDIGKHISVYDIYSYFQLWEQYLKPHSERDHKIITDNAYSLAIHYYRSKNIDCTYKKLEIET